MTRPLHDWPVTLGLYPTSRGFGWAAFNEPFHLIDHGLYTVHRDKNAKCLDRIDVLLNKLTPETIVLEAFDRRSSIRSRRIQRLCEAVIARAGEHKAEVEIFTRADVQTCFAGVGAMTRDELARAVANTVTELRPKLPENRRPWESEDRRMALFNAAALVLTHYHFGSNRLFGDINRQS